MQASQTQPDLDTERIKHVTEVDCAHVDDRVPEDTASVAFARVLDRY